MPAFIMLLNYKQWIINFVQKKEEACRNNPTNKMVILC